LINVFISHSGTDAQLAASLIDLLRVALPGLHPETIRCTSVPGYRLPGGASTDDQLRAEMREARIFIGLITKESLASTYVLFELGARWGAGLHLTPLMAGAMEPSALKAPLDRVNAHSCNVESHIQQLLTEISKTLGIEPVGSAIYDRHLKQLVALSQKEGELRKHWGKSLRVLPSAYDVYSEIPTLIQTVEGSKDAKRMIVIGTLHGSVSRSPETGARSSPAMKQSASRHLMM